MLAIANVPLDGGSKVYSFKEVQVTIVNKPMSTATESRNGEQKYVVE